MTKRQAKREMAAHLAAYLRSLKDGGWPYEDAQRDDTWTDEDCDRMNDVREEMRCEMERRSRLR